MGWPESPLVGLDFETTGVDPLFDLPVQLALVWCDGRGDLRCNSFLVDPEREVPEGAFAVHGISTARARAEGRSLEATAHYLHRHLGRAAAEGIPVVAMNASFDVTIAECLFARAGLPSLEWRAVIDPLVIDRRVDRYRKGKRRLENLCETYGVNLAGAHDAAHDAAAALHLARRIGRAWPEVAVIEPEELTRLQSGWHREWAVDFHAWCLREGREGLSENDYLWPARCPLRAAQESESRMMSMSSSPERGFTTARRMAVLP